MRSLRFRTRRGWDIAMVAAIVTAVSLGWLTAPGSNCAVAAHPGRPVARACPSARVRPGEEFVTGRHNPAGSRGNGGRGSGYP